MKFLIVTATHFEIATFAEVIGDCEIFSSHLSKYKFNAHQIDILVTGVGMVFTSFHLSSILVKEKYDFAINAGVAGAIDRNLALGEVVNVVNDYFYELGAEDGDEWLNLAQLGLLSEIDKPYSRDGLHNTILPELSNLKKLKQVKGHTVNTIHGNLQSIKNIENRSKAQIESMEGAAFLYCCLQHQLPCAQIRAISNYVEVRNKATWQMSKAIFSLNEFLKSILNN